MNQSSARRDGLHADLTGAIIDCAKRVYRELGSGFLEKVYESALAIELRAAGLEVGQQFPIDVFYRGVKIGAFNADLIVNGLVIVELKAIESVPNVHEVQLVNYLRATRIEIGLLINFGPNLDIRRRILTNDRKIGRA